MMVPSHCHAPFLLPGKVYKMQAYNKCRIETQEGVDRGQALFCMFPEAVTNIALRRIDQWFQSPQYQGLANNCKQMDMYIDNNAPAVSTFISDITPQTIRKAYVEFKALIKKFLETDPLFSPKQGSMLNSQQEHIVTKLINDNLEKTSFRERCLLWTIDHIVRYGTAATYSYATTDYNANGLMTVKSDFEGEYEQQYKQGEPAIVSVPIHPLNVIIDPRTNFMVEPDFLGFIGDISIADLSVLIDNDSYIQKNLKEVFEACKKGLPDEHWYGGPTSERKDFSTGHSNITRLWTRLPLEGNEADTSWYAIEIVGKKIIRIDENILDDNVIPLAIMRILPRQFTWYGNSPLIDKICIQNLQYWIINTSVESVARLMDRLILYRTGSLDVEAINSRGQTGGLIPYAGQLELQNLIYAPDLPSVGISESKQLTELARREDQDSSAMPNFNPQAEGGPTNKTLGGAQMMASIGEMKMSSMVDDLVVGLKDIAKQHLVLMRNIVTGNKDTILGNIQFSCKVSNVFNYIREAIDSQNRLSQLINFRATKIEEFNAVNIDAYIEDWVRNSLKRENIGDYIDKQMMETIKKKAKNALNTPPAAPGQPGAPVGAPAGAGTKPVSQKQPEAKPQASIIQGGMA
jgi:hypothetical protein